MPWFVVDDSAHSHPKLIRAGNAAVGLWMRGGSYAAQHLTDGVVPAAIAAMYGTAPQCAKLVKLGLWHEGGHTCPRCAQPIAGDYVMHDYHVYNPTRRQVRERRDRAAEKKRRQRGGGDSAHDSETNAAGIANDSSSNRDGKANESGSNRTPNSEETPGQSDASPGDSSGTRARAFPSPPLPSKEQQDFPASEDAEHGSLTGDLLFDSGGEVPAPREDLSEFGAFWIVYPKKRDRQDAIKAWKAAIKSGADPQQIIAAATAYARERSGQDPKFTKYPATWLRKGCYENEPETARPHLQAVSGGWQPWSNPVDQSVYLNGW